MKKLAIALVLLAAASVAVATTTTTAGTALPNVTIAASTTGTESAPSGASVGLDLTNIGGVLVMLKTTSAATAGGTLQAYVYNNEVAAWYRVADLDLTATATTLQSWPALYVPVSRGRITWVPSGIGSVSPTVYMIGMAK